MCRPTKIDYYLNIAKEVATRSTCIKRKYGCVIVKNDGIISTGYNGAPQGLPNCCDCGSCYRATAERGTDYISCVSSHAEMNALLTPSKEQLLGAEMFLAGIDVSTGEEVLNIDCCSLCKRMIINAGISKVHFRHNLKDEDYNGYSFVCPKDWNIKDITGGY